jgi:lipopolysaccharide/colanic/teichoic acid biosynthesis glycosyltransferase
LAEGKKVDGRAHAVSRAATARSAGLETEDKAGAKRAEDNPGGRIVRLDLGPPAESAGTIRLLPHQGNGPGGEVGEPMPITLEPAQLLALEEALEDECVAGRYYSVGKRVLDLILVVAALPIWVPLYLVIAAVLLFAQGRPLHYRQDRVGMNGKDFSIIKFRTMVKDADAELSDLLLREPGLDREYQASVKLQVDPRVTRLGALLRRWSLDELPQLWNVLLGHMSLVGPRPVRRGEWNVCYGPLAWHVFRFRPGMTGLWQTSRRPATTYAERVFMDAIYSMHCSQLSDLRVLVATVPTIFRGHGAV